MGTKSFEIKHLHSGGIITNYNCPSQCRHCLYKSGPRRDKRYLDPQTAETILARSAALNCRSVHIGGGEPLLNPPALQNILEIARNAGISIEYVETNAAWFRDQAEARLILESLRAVGLQTLLISISPMHNEFIPFARTKGLMALCQQMNIAVFPWISEFVADLNRFAAKRPHALQEYESVFGRKYRERILKRYWIHLGGRALDTFRPALPGQSIDTILNTAGSCAADLGNTSHFHIDLYSNFIPGLCAGLAIAVQDLGQPLKPDIYPIITLLANVGVKGLFEMASRDYGFETPKKEYINKCDLCTDIRHHLVNQDFPSKELRPTEFYTLP